MAASAARARADAVETFVRSFAHTRSMNRPAEVVRVGKMWVVRDVERSGRGVRSEELIVDSPEPAEAARLVSDYLTHKQYRLVVFRDVDSDVAAVRAAYRALGYRPRLTETLFVREQPGPPRMPQTAAATVRRVTDAAMAERVRKAARRKMLDADDLSAARPRVRLYAATIDDKPVSWCRCIHMARGAGYVADVYTTPEWRRRGVATAVMTRMLIDDNQAGARRSVLIASTAGAMLYPHLGYERVALLEVFTPLR